MRRLLLTSLGFLGCGGSAVPYPGDLVSECGFKTEVDRFSTTEGTCRRLDVPVDIERELAPLGECPDGLRCGIVMPGLPWLSWADTTSSDAGVFVGEEVPLEGDACPLSCETP